MVLGGFRWFYRSFHVLVTTYCEWSYQCVVCDQHNYSPCLCCDLSGCLPKSGPLDFATKNSFPLLFVGEEALVGI